MKQIFPYEIVWMILDYRTCIMYNDWVKRRMVEIAEWNYYEDITGFDTDYENEDSDDRRDRLEYNSVVNECDFSNYYE